MTEFTPWVERGQPLTPRQDRIESAIVRSLASGGTRTPLRESVYDFANLLRRQGIPLERAIARVTAVALGGTSGLAVRDDHAVGDSPSDRMELIVQWCASRYRRAD